MSQEWKVVPVEPTTEMRDAINGLLAAYDDGSDITPSFFMKMLINACPASTLFNSGEVERLTALCIEKDERMSAMNKSWAACIEQRDTLGIQLAEANDLLKKMADIDLTATELDYEHWQYLLGEVSLQLATCEQTPPPDKALCDFYQVSDYPGLVRELVGHVAQLQDSAKRNVKPWEDTFPPTLLPAYVERVNAANSTVLPRSEPVAPWFYFVECDDPDYSGLFNHESEAQTQANDHGGKVVKLWNVPPTWKPAAQPQGEPVAWQYRVSAGPQTGWSLWHDGKGEEFKQSYQVETRPLYAEQPAPVPVVPEGYCIMPRQLTAENGAKALLLGEFKLQVTEECPECRELDEPTEGCSICDGQGEYGQKHTIPWDQIKFIYSKAVSGLSIKQPWPATTQEPEGA